MSSSYFLRRARKRPTPNNFDTHQERIKRIALSKRRTETTYLHRSKLNTTFRVLTPVPSTSWSWDAKRWWEFPQKDTSAYSRYAADVVHLCKLRAAMLVPISAVKFHANKYVNMKAIFPVMNTTWAVVKIRPEKIQACPGFEIPFKLQGRPCWIPLRRNGCTILYRSRDKNPRETRMYSNQLHVDSPNLCYRSTALEDEGYRLFVREKA